MNAMRRLLPPLIALALTLAVPNAAAAGVVFGSFVNPGMAEAQRNRVAAGLDVAVRVVAVDINGERRYRVVAAEEGTEAQARGILAQARAAGYLDAWYWPGVAPPLVAPSVVAPSERVVPSESGPTPTAVAEAQREPVGEPQPIAEAAARQEAQVAAEHPAPAETAKRPLASASSAGQMRLDAGDPIVVPRYDSVNILIDGHLSEPVWNEVPGYDNMVVVEPDTLQAARFRSVARYIYTEHGLYVGVWNEQPPETLIARLSSRDDFINRDGWGITIDTSGQGLYGYWFSVNLGGSVMDGKVAPEREFSREWDGPWDSATQALDDGWSAELFLPWSMMTMPQVEGDRTMGIFTNRKVAYIDERWGWPGLPFTGARFMSALQPMLLPEVAPRQQMAVFPYLTASHDTVNGQSRYRAGADVFWRPSSNFQVTAAAYPDFGAVESDDVIINLTARETFFPEKRLFFLEGNEIFVTSGRSSTSRRSTSSSSSGASGGGSRRTQNSFGGSPSTVLNTRRIGAAPVVDVPGSVNVGAAAASQPTELLGAAKIVGQTGGLRYGVLTAFEDDPMLRGEWDDADDADAEMMLEGIGRDFGVARVLYETTGAGRQAVGYMGTLLDHPLQTAKVHSVDTHHLAFSGRLRADVQLLASEVECDPNALRAGRQWWHCRDNDHGGVTSSTGYGGWADIYFTQRQGLMHNLALDYYDDGLNINDLGFLQRNNMMGGRYSLSYVQPNILGLRRMATNVNVGYYENEDGQPIRSGVFAFNSLTFNNLSEVRTSFFHFPERWDDLETRGNGAYKVDARSWLDVSFGTDTSKAFSWSVMGGGMEEELGGITAMAAAGFTYKPLDRFSLDFDLNYFGHDGWLRYQQDRDLTTFEANNWQPKLAMDLFLSARQQLRLTMQWAGIDATEQEFWQIAEDGSLVPRLQGDESDDFAVSQVTAQLRYRWQIAPLSDLFVVYTRGGNRFFTDSDAELADGQLDHLLDALEQPIADIFVVKLRYRLGG